MLDIGFEWELPEIDNRVKLVEARNEGAVEEAETAFVVGIGRLGQTAWIVTN